jgi:catechol-2,3-dioxygenase
LAVPVDDVGRAAAFYEDWFGARIVPSPRFAIPVAWVLLDDVQLHLVQRPGEVASAYHFGLAIENRERFEALYWRAMREGIVDRETFHHHLYEASGGALQLYLRDPAGNVVECDYPDVTDLDPTIAEVRWRWADLSEQSAWNRSASLFVSGAGGRSQR